MLNYVPECTLIWANRKECNQFRTGKVVQTTAKNMRELIIPQASVCTATSPCILPAHCREWALVFLVWRLAVMWADVAKGQIDTCVVNNAWPRKGVWVFFFFPLIKRPPRELPEWKCHKSCRKVLISATPLYACSPHNNNSIHTPQETDTEHISPPPLRTEVYNLWQ